MVVTALRPAKVLEPAEASCALPAVIGGKAAGLARLESAGARVPPWVVLPATLFAAHLQRAREHAGLEEHLAALDALGLTKATAAPARAQLEQIVESLRRAIEHTPLSEEAEHAVSHALSMLGAETVAVRSSMVGEDSQQHSFAGQCDTVLHVRGMDAARAAVLRCWSSAFTGRSLIYRRTIAQEGELPAMAVIVQRMIDGGTSGVMFTVNPVNNEGDQALISSVKGTGDALVSGAVDADEFVIASDGRVLSQALGDGGSLSSEQIARVHAEGLRLARELGEPLDLEWTLEGDTLYMLQARPITSRPRPLPAVHVTPAASAVHRIIWDNSNIQESYCGVTTPLTFSFASRAYASVYEQTMSVLGLPERTIAEHRPMLRNLLGLIRGRVYYNINNWYRGLLLLPSFGRNKADMERMMGLEEPADIVVDHRRSLADRARALPRMGMTLGRLLAAIRGLSTTAPEFMRAFEEHAARFDRRALADASVAELMRQTTWLWTHFVERWHVPIVNDFHVMMASGRLRRIVEKAVGGRADAIYHALLGGVEGLESAEPTRWLMRLAEVAREDEHLAALLTRSAPPSVEELQSVNAAFASDLRDYIERYGDRTIGELKLETVSHREDPAFLLKVIRNYLDQPSLDASRLSANEQANRIAAEQEVEQKCGLIARTRFRRALHAARSGIRARESMRLARTRLFGMYRDTYRALGSRLHERGLLSAPRDVFYLTVEEIEAWYNGTAVTTDLAALATLRRREFAGFEAEELPNRLESRDGILITDVAAKTQDSESPVLRGNACCAGVVEARVRVIMSATDDLDVRGLILTTLRTDPGWAPLFPGAAGILVERGSTLSHSAVLARELGIPAVVGIPGLLKAVHDGDLVRMDGAAGTIEILERR